MSGWKIPDESASGAPMTMPPAGPSPRPSRSRNSIEVEVHASVGVVRSGDKLVIALPGDPPQAEVDDIRERMAADLPGVKVVIIPANALMVYRP